MYLKATPRQQPDRLHEFVFVHSAIPPRVDALELNVQLEIPLQVCTYVYMCVGCGCGCEGRGGRGGGWGASPTEVKPK